MLYVQEFDLRARSLWQANAAKQEKEDYSKTISTLEHKLLSLLESRDQSLKEAKVCQSHLLGARG